MEFVMDNKYGLGSAKVSHVAHERRGSPRRQPQACQHCGSESLILCPTLDDHFCKECGEYQGDVPAEYSTGRSSNY
jgi:hypothetical protein